MAGSLKGYTPALARIIGATPAALYERQRALVRAGLLDEYIEQGRGPGSGARDTGESVALLLISVLAAESLSDAAARAKLIAETAPIGVKSCPLTKHKKFYDALAAILLSRVMSTKVISLTVSRTHPHASIKYRHELHKPASGANIHVIEFGESPTAKAGIRVDATLEGDALRTIAKDRIATALDSGEPK
jgi:hypothetical protein